MNSNELRTELKIYGAIAGVAFAALVLGYILHWWWMLVLAAIVCYILTGMGFKTFKEYRNYFSVQNLQQETDKVFMKSPYVTEKLRSVLNTIDISHMRYPEPICRDPPTKEGVVFWLVPDPWLASPFQGDWYALNDNPWVFNEEGKAVRLVENVVRNAGFGSVLPRYVPVNIPATSESA